MPTDPRQLELPADTAEALSYLHDDDGGAFADDFLDDDGALAENAEVAHV